MPIYDFILIEEKGDTTVAVTFIQFTAIGDKHGIKTKLRNISNNYTFDYLTRHKDCENYLTEKSKKAIAALEKRGPIAKNATKTSINMIKDWIQKLADLGSKKEFVFQEVLIHYSEQIIHYGDFNCYSFNLSNGEKRAGRTFAKDLKAFLCNPSLENISSIRINERIATSLVDQAKLATQITIPHLNVATKHIFATDKIHKTDASAFTGIIETTKETTSTERSIAVVRPSGIERNIDKRDLAKKSAKKQKVKYQ